MPIDASIPLQAQPIKLESPVNQLAMVGEALKIGELQRGIQTQNKLRELYSQGVDVSTPEGFKSLASVDPASAIKLRADALQGRKLQAETGLKEYELKNNKINTAITRLANLHSPEEAAASIAEQVQSGDLPPERAQQIMQQLKTMPFQQFKTSQLSSILSAKDNLTLAEQAKHNRTTEGISAGHLAIAQRGLTQGTIPAGYRLSADGKNLEAIPGGPTTTPLAPKELQTREAKYPMATQAVKTVESKADKLIQDIETLKNHPGLDSITGTIYGRTPSATKEGRAAQALYDSIVARGGFQELAAMRAASPTGGALGNVSNQEGQQLKDAFGTLNRTQDASDLRKQLARVADDVRGAKQRVREAYDMTYDYKGGVAPTAPAAGGKDDPLGIR